MELISEIESILNEIVRTNKNVEGYYLINGDGKEILSSPENMTEYGDLSEIFSKIYTDSSLLSKDINSSSVNRVFINYDEKNIIILKIASNIILTFIFKKNINPLLILLELKKTLSLLSSLLEEY